tara:strand:- start:79 stop:558 length:480 start_codon:yes stop_codon:yes gene_type:complete
VDDPKQVNIMTKYFKILALFLSLAVCAQNVTEMKTPKEASKKIIEFLEKKKFVQQANPNFYPGIADEKMRPILVKKINLIATDFLNVAESKNPTDIKYQKKIEVGLSRFTEVYMELDTEDREKICNYIEELMDIVHLESSNGQLNKFMYGFDPKSKMID